MAEQQATGMAPNRGKAGRRLIWLGAAVIALVALYAAAGFALVPWLVKTRLPEITQKQFGYRASVADVRFDPFKLHAELADLRLAEPDGAQMIGLGLLAVDLEWASLFQRTWRFALVRLTAPHLKLAIDKNGRFNLAEFIAALDRDPPREKQAPPRLLIDRIELTTGRVDFDDRRAGYSNSFTPIEFAISNLSTLPDHNGPYTFSATSARGGVIRWKGEASLNPIAGRGELRLETISLPDLAVYALPRGTMGVESGKFAATLPYRFKYADGKLAFDVEKAAVKVTDLEVRLGGAGAPALQLPSLEISAVDASLAKRDFSIASVRLADLALRLAGAKDPSVKLGSIAIGRVAGGAAAGEVNVESIALSGGNLVVRRDARGQVDLMAMASPAAAAPPQAANPKADAGAQPVPWRVVVRQVALDNFGLAYADLGSARPLQVDVAKVALKLALEASQGSAGLNVVASDGELTFRDLVANAKSAEPLRVGELGVGGARLDLAARSLAMERAWLKSVEMKLLLDAAGRLGLLDMIPGGGEAATAPAAKDSAVPFKVAIKSVDISGVGADFEDRGSGIRLRAQDGNARLTGVSSNPADPLGFEAGFRLREGGDFNAKGRAIPATGAVEAAVRVGALALAPMQPLVARFVRLKLASGSVSADGRLQVGGKGPQVRYSGKLGLADLLLTEENGKQFAALKAASAEGLDFALAPNALDIPELRLDGLEAQLLIDADRSLNATRLLVQAAPKDAAAPGAPKPGAAVATPAAAPAATAASGPATPAATSSTPAAGPSADEPFPVALRRLRLSNAKLDFQDLSLRPQFAAKIHELNGVVTGLSTSPSTRSRLELDGRVDEFGLARIRGELNPFFPRNNTDVNVVFRNVDMTTATPYAMKFAGYKIAAGKISLDLNYKVRNSQLEGDNQVVIDQLTLGERVDSPDAMKLPLELAIALLKDSDGRIDLGLPVSGSLDDPQFSYGAVIWKAVLNVLTRIVTAPFRALGALFGGDGARLESIDFDPGSAVILPPEREKLRQVVQVLSKRSQLKLAVPGQYNEEADAPVLRDKAMRREILLRAGVKLAEGEESGPLDIADRAQRTALREVFTARHGAAELEKLRAEADRGALPAQAGAAKRDPVPVWRRAINLAQGELSVSDPGAFYGALSARLAASQPLPQDALQRLAGERSNAIVTALKDAGVDAARVAQPAVEKTELKAKAVPLKLGLAAR